MPSAVLPVLQFPIYSKLESEQSVIFFKLSGVGRPSGEAATREKRGRKPERGRNMHRFSFRPSPFLAKSVLMPTRSAAHSVWELDGKAI